MSIIIEGYFPIGKVKRMGYSMKNSGRGRETVRREFFLNTIWRGFSFNFILFITFICTDISLSGENTGASKILGALQLPGEWVVFAPFKKEDMTLPKELLKKVPEELTLGATSRKAVKLRRGMNKIDFTSLFGGQALENVAYIYLVVDSPTDQTVTLGMGADWWFQAWMDGKPLYDTLENGNVEWPPSITNHIVNVHLTKGKHILAVRFISGSGSSVFALGGPEELRKIPSGQWKRVKPASDNLYGAETVPNCDFEKGGKGSPWIPEGWVNAPAPFSFEGKELSASSPDKNDVSLMINNTTGGKGVKRKLYTRLSLIPGKQYKISYRARDRRGGAVSISLRENINAGPVYFIRAIDTDKCTQYCFIENPKPYLVIESANPSHVILDEISVKPCFDKSKAFANWMEQRFPADNAFNQVSNTVTTDHIAWGKPYAGGTLKLLTVIPAWEQRLTVELSQRLDFQCQPVFFGSANGNAKTAYWIRDSNGNPVLYNPVASAIEKMEQGTDCILIDYVNASGIPANMVGKILEKVKNGTGLVIVGINQPYYPSKDGKRNDALEKYKEGVWAKALCPGNAVTDDAAFIHLQAVTHAESEFYKYGKGRIVYLRGGDNLSGKDRTEFELRISTIGKAVLWATNRVPQTAITSVRLPGENPNAPAFSIERNALPAAAAVTLSRGAVKGMKLKLWISDRNFETLYSKTAALAEGAGNVTVELPRLKAGTLYVHTQLYQDANVSDWQSALLNVIDKPVIKDVWVAHRKRPYHVRGEEISGKVVIERELATNEHLEISLLDADGRVWYRANVPAVKGKEVPFSFDSKRLLVMRNSVMARVIDQNGVVSEMDKTVIVALPKEWHAENFGFGGWRIGTGGYLGSVQNSILREKYGINFVLVGNQIKTAEAGAKANIAPVFNAAYGATTFGMDNEIVGDKNAPERKLCLTSKKLKEKITRSIEQIIKPASVYAPLAYFLDHEVDILGYTKRAKPGTDICFSKSCLEDLRTFLKKEYKDLSALNKSWGTDFKNWDEVKPIVLSEAVEKGQISRWIDHRRHMDRVWTDLSLFRMLEVRKYDPDGDGVDHNMRSGPTVNDSFSGIDYWQLMHKAIGGSTGLPYQNDFLRRRYLIWSAGAHWYPQSASDNFDLSCIRICRQPWFELMQQSSGFSLYSEAFTGHGPLLFNDIFLLNPDLTSSQLGNNFAGTLRQIRSGIDTFVLNSKKDCSGIGLYYSRASEHASTAWQKIHEKNKTAKEINPRRSQFVLWAPSIMAVNRGYRSVAYGEIADGILQKGDIKLLIIPFSQAISLKEAEEIRNFVNRGGCVVADIRPAVSDEHGNLYDGGLLDAVFGVKHDPSWKSYEPKKGNMEINLENDKLHFSNVILGPELKLAGAKVMGKADVPVYLVNNYGKGKAVLLNFYMEPKSGAVTKNFDQFVEMILTSCNIPRLFNTKISDSFWLTEAGEKISVSNSPEKKTTTLSGSSATEDPGEVEGLMFDDKREIPQIVRLLNGNIECIGLGADKYEPRGNGIQTVHIRPQKRGHVYDLRTNIYLGEKDAYDVTMPLEDVMFHAIVPYRIQKLLLDMKTEKGSDGALFIVSNVVVQPKEASSENHVIRFSLIAPDGKEWTDFAVNKIAKNGTVSHTFVLPLNAPGGKWKITAREAISGLEAVSYMKN